MADPSRITPAELSALLDQARQLTADSPLSEQIAYHREKARVLDGIAAALNTPDAYYAASDAWQQVAALLARTPQAVTP
jgi:hypothetical protein